MSHLKPRKSKSSDLFGLAICVYVLQAYFVIIVER